MDGRLPFAPERRSRNLSGISGSGCMMTHGWQWISASLLVGCLASFGWAMRRFFLQPAGMTTGMKVIKAFGIFSGLVHIAAIVATPGVTAVRGFSGAILYLCALGL